MAAAKKRTRESVLFITLDSCRFDTFDAADVPNMKAVGPLHRAQAPSHYTYGSHSAMFVGFTPGLSSVKQPVLNPKFGKLFKLVGAGFPGKGTESYELHGRNVIEGFKNRGFATLGTGAVGWFDPTVPTGLHLTDSFEHFFYPGNSHSLKKQVEWLAAQIAASDKDIFAFVNAGETHVPYYYAGAAWSEADNPCVPFQTIDRSAECRERQIKCCEFIDAQLASLLESFQDSTIIICADHGDCWGEDGLWEHGISHSCTLTVPLLVRVRGLPVHFNGEANDSIGAKPTNTG